MPQKNSCEHFSNRFQVQLNLKCTLKALITIHKTVVQINIVTNCIEIKIKSTIQKLFNIVFRITFDLYGHPSFLVFLYNSYSIHTQYYHDILSDIWCRWNKVPSLRLWNDANAESIESLEYHPTNYRNSSLSTTLPSVVAK